MNHLEEEKLIALKNSDGEVVSSVSKEELEAANKKMSFSAETKAYDGIKTRKRKKREYAKIWDSFLIMEPDFKNYMGYGKDEILKIGFKKFIDFMDWSSEEDILKYKTDRVKALPCCHCHSKMTTFQLDLGLCNECKAHYGITKLTDTLAAQERNESGSSLSTIATFIYFEDFRKMYAVNRPLKELITDMFVHDLLAGGLTKDVLINRIIGDNKNEKDLLLIGEELCLVVSETVKGRFESIKAIILSDDSKEDKIKRVAFIF